MEEEFDFEEGNIEGLVQQFERTIQQGETKFFDVEEFLSLADHYMMQLSLERAGEVLEMALTQHPGSTELQLRKARLWVRKGLLAQSLGWLQALQATESRNPEIQVLMAEIYSELQEHDRAIQCYHRAIELADAQDKEYLYIDLSGEYQNKGDLDRARFYLRKAITLNPRNDFGYLEYYFLLQMENKVQEGLDFFKGLTDADPYNPVAWHYLGLCYQDQELLEEAIRAFDFVVVIDDQYADAYFQKAECYMDLGFFSQALASLEEAESFYEYKPRLLYMKGECLEQLHQWEAGLQVYQQATRLAPDMTESWIGMSICLQELGRIKEALAYAEHALALEPDNHHYQLVRAAMLRDLGRLGDAETVYQRLLEAEPELIEIYLEMSTLYLKLDDVAQMEASLVKGLTIDEQSPELLYRLAATYFYAGKVAQGTQWLHLALDRQFSGYIELFNFIPELSENTYITDIIQNHPAYGQDSPFYS